MRDFKSRFGGLRARPADRAGPSCHAADRSPGSAGGCLEEDLVEVPLQEIPPGSVGGPFGQVYGLSGLSVELFAIAEIGSQAGAYVQAVAGIYAEISAVEQCMDVGPQQKPVVQAVLSSGGDRTDMGCLQDRRDVGAANSAPAVVGVQDNRLERLLAEPVGRQSRIAEYGPGPVPGLAVIQFHRSAEGQLQQIGEVRRYRRVG